MSVGIVVASFRENLKWVLDWGYLGGVTVLNCGGQARWWELESSSDSSFRLHKGTIPSVQCANSGKEAGMYLQYIIQHYDNLSPKVVFLQGDLGVSTFIRHIPKPVLAKKLSVLVSNVEASKDTVGAIGTDLELLPQTIVPFPPSDHPVFKRVVKADQFPLETVAGHVGAQFWVRRELILKFPKSYYESIYNLRRTTSLAHDLEFVWPSVFQPKTTTIAHKQHTVKEASK
jgi:hypothetical protein